MMRLAIARKRAASCVDGGSMGGHPKYVTCSRCGQVWHMDDRPPECYEPEFQKGKGRKKNE